MEVQQDSQQGIPPETYDVVKLCSFEILTNQQSSLPRISLTY